MHRYFDNSAADAVLDAYSKWLVQAIARGIYIGHLAQHEGQVVGGAGLVLLDWGPTRNDHSSLRGRLVNVFVNPSLRRRGIATALVKRTLATAAERGIRTVGLSANASSHSLYESLGFRSAGAEMTRVRD